MHQQRLLRHFRKKSDKPLLKGAFIEEAIYVGDDQLDTLVNIKSKDELIGELLDYYSLLLRMLFLHLNLVEEQLQVLLKPYQKEKVKILVSLKLKYKN